MGYKAKQGYVMYRARVRRGGRKRPVHKGIVYGKPSSQGITQLKPTRNLRSVAEERVGRKCEGLRVLNSYWVNEDSTYKYFEVILVDPAHAAIRNDPRINWVCNPVHKHRELRGLTSAGKSYRGLRTKGHAAHKLRPSRRASWRKRNSLSLRRYLWQWFGYSSQLCSSSSGVLVGNQHALDGNMQFMPLYFIVLPVARSVTRAAVTRAASTGPRLRTSVAATCACDWRFQWLYQHAGQLTHCTQGSLRDTLPLPCRMLTSLHESPMKSKLLEKATARRTAHRVMAKKKPKGSDKKQKAEPTKGKGKGKAAKAKPAPQPGMWLDRDCNAALNMQRIGESRWRPLELCYWPDQGALPAKGKEYPGLGYKRLRDKPPKAQQQQQQPAVAQ
ncbi:hypothetical protein QJQ45_012531 [Haematococcus lacustris]|nr:hypothetical protein QJQ45_012531 [Haematococcus lacustris]